MILIEVRNGSKLIGRCDAKCYDATDNRWICVCQNKNHGRGLKQALANTRQDGNQWVDEFCKDKEIDQKIILNENISQMKLF